MSTSVVLPDGKVLQFQGPVSVEAVATTISPRLAKAAVAAVVDGRTVDLATVIEGENRKVRILTDRDAESLEILRHSASHILAQAMVRLFGNGVKYTIGPALMDDFQYGFYYDFDLPSPIGQEDLAKVEQEMRKIIDEKITFQRVELPAAEARAKMIEIGQSYKAEMIDDLVKAEGAAAATISLYRQGEFLDMCRGPHLPDTGRLKAFKLIATAGAYWRGDEKNKMLTRVYGTAFFDAKALDEHLARVEEARKRDHRVIGKQLELFHLTDVVGPGLVLWMPKGAIIRGELESWIRVELNRRGYQSVYTPHIGKLGMYRTSGHYPYYRDSQYPPLVEQETLDKLAAEGCSCATLCNHMEQGQIDGYLLKPMNCPHHIQIFKASPHSYRDLPVRLAEFGTVYRFEQSGELSGMVRVRGFTQDDAHLFCTPEQLEGEIESCVALTQLVLGTLGLTDYWARVSLRDPASDKYVGSPHNWARAEDNLRSVVKKLNLKSVEAIGEAAFYGPKIDFIVRDCIGRQWQLGTVQVDYNLPERFGLEYAGADNTPHRPVMVHRAPLGSMERFIGILIEHFGGAFPLWLSPVQVAVLPVSDKYNDYAGKVADSLKAAGIRVELDDSPEKIGAKIRRATLLKIPYMAVVGQREAETDTVAVRDRTAGDKGASPVAEFVAALRAEIDAKVRRSAV